MIVAALITFQLSILPAHFLCPITSELMTDPIINEFGNSYEKEAKGINDALPEGADDVIVTNPSHYSQPVFLDCKYFQRKKNT